MKITREEAKRRILQTDGRHPLLVGEVALMLGPLWSLTETEGLLHEMVREGALRELTDEEKREFDTRYGYIRCK